MLMLLFWWPYTSEQAYFPIQSTKKFWWHFLVFSPRDPIRPGLSGPCRVEFFIPPRYEGFHTSKGEVSTAPLNSFLLVSCCSLSLLPLDFCWALLITGLHLTESRSARSAPSLYPWSGLLFPRCRILHWSLMNFRMFLSAHLSKLSRSCWRAAHPSGVLATPPALCHQWTC